MYESKNIIWPSFKFSFDRVGSINQTISEFVRLVINDKSLLHNIDFSEEFYNVVLPIERKHNIDFYLRLASEHGKKLKIYFYNEPFVIEGYRKIPLIFDYIDIEGKMDLLFASNHIDYGNRIALKYGSDIMIESSITDKNISRNELGFFYFKNEQITGRSLVKYSDDFKNDIKIAEIIPYIDDKLGMFDAIRIAMIEYITNIKAEVSLRQDRTNILILCSTTKSINTKVYMRIIRDVLGDVIYRSEDIYFLGRDLSDINMFKDNENCNIVRCTLENFTLIYNDINNPIKFDVIVSEHCPYPIINKNIKKLNTMLSDTGILISPKYMHNVKSCDDYFTKVIDGNSYEGYMISKPT